MCSDVPDTSRFERYLRVFQITLSSLIVAVWALTAAVFPNQPLAIVLGLLSVLLLAFATISFAGSNPTDET